MVLYAQVEDVIKEFGITFNDKEQEKELTDFIYGLLVENDELENKVDSRIEELEGKICVLEEENDELKDNMLDLEEENNELEELISDLKEAIEIYQE